MGKYSYKDGVFKGEAKIKMIMFVANELAEANRLKRLELDQHAIVRGDQQIPSREDLEDKA